MCVINNNFEFKVFLALFSLTKIGFIRKLCPKWFHKIGPRCAVAITFSTYFCRLFFFGCDAEGQGDQGPML
jgi:hypothetical protein